MRPLLLICALVPLTGCPSSKRQAPAVPDTSAVKAPRKKVPDLPRRGPLAQKIRYEQGKSLLRAGKPEAAVKEFKQSIDADPEGEAVANCYLGIGAAMADLGRPGPAVEAYRKVVALRPTDPESFRALAMGLEDQGEVDEAIRTLEQSLALNADQLAAYQDLAALHLRQSDTDGAKQVYLRYELKRTVLIQTLGLSKDVEQREAAAFSLGEARDDATAKALGLALTDRDRRVRLAVVSALGMQALSEGAGPLKRLLTKTSDPDERRQIEVSLKAIKDAPPADIQPPLPADSIPAPAPGASGKVPAP